MLAQLAQFGTVSGVQSMNTTLSSLSDSLRSSQALSGATMVGHQILAPASAVNYYGQPLGGAVQIADGASSVTLTITDASGQVVRHVNLATATGQQPFSWDGHDRQRCAGRCRHTTRSAQSRTSGGANVACRSPWQRASAA